MLFCAGNPCWGTHKVICQHAFASKYSRANQMVWYFTSAPSDMTSESEYHRGSMKIEQARHVSDLSEIGQISFGELSVIFGQHYNRKFFIVLDLTEKLRLHAPFLVFVHTTTTATSCESRRGNAKRSSTCLCSSGWEISFFIRTCMVNLGGKIVLLPERITLASSLLSVVSFSIFFYMVLNETLINFLCWPRFLLFLPTVI